MTKEQVYDEKIHALMGQIIEICKEHKIPMVASFAIPTDDDPNLFCSSSVPDENDQFPFHLRDMKRAIDAARRGGDGSPVLMMTVKKSDGSEDMIAVV